MKQRDPRPKPHQWRQTGGDMDPGKYGAVVARYDGDAVDIFEIEPVRECVGDRAATEVGFPFWSRAAYYDAATLSLENAFVKKALESSGVDMSTVADEWRSFVIAEALLRYGYAVDDGPSGWAKDVLGDNRVFWNAGGHPKGWRYLADEDRDFRHMLRESR